jgi:hypothetical protein
VSVPGETSAYSGCNDRPVFVGACPRSGTTLLRTMLNTHPDLAIPRETRYLLSIWEHRNKWAGLEERRKRHRMAKVIYEAEWTRADRLRTTKDEAVARFDEVTPTLGSLLGSTLALYADATGKKRWGDKRPMYARYLDAVFAMFPDAQYVNVVRDPRASVASMRKLGWYDGDVIPAIELWLRSVDAVGPWRRRLGPDQFFDLQYEDFVADPESGLTRITSYLGLSPDAIPTMLRYYEKNDETAEKYHWRLNEPVTTDTLRAWESVLDPGEVALIEKVAGDRMATLGYERTTDDAPPAALSRAYSARRRKVMKWRRRIELTELRRRLDYREPVMAKLTSGQRDVAAKVPTPPFWQRHIGKPR